MSVTVTQLGVRHLQAVDNLMKSNSKTLGFLPGAALLDHLKAGNALGAVAKDGEIAGYLLYAAYSDRFRVVHLCVADEFRGGGIARRLMESLKKKASGQRYIVLHCRRNFPAHDMWPKLGFSALAEKRGRSSAGHILEQWHCPLGPPVRDEQIDLFREKMSPDALDVVIDAQIVFNLAGPDSNETIPSKALYEDYSIHTLFLYITGETYNEIARNEDEIRRKKSREIAQQFPRIVSGETLTKHYEARLKNVLPGQRESDQSDIRQLAITAASEHAKIFATEDQALLRRSEDIARATGIRVVSPTQLIMEIYQPTDDDSPHARARRAGHWEWKRPSADDLSVFPYEDFLHYGETKGKFREKLQSFLAVPGKFESDLLRIDGRISSIRITEKRDYEHRVRLARVAPLTRGGSRRGYGPPLESALITDTIWSAVRANADTVIFARDCLTPNMHSYAADMGLQECGDDFVKFCFSGSLDRASILSRIRARRPNCVQIYEAMKDYQLGRSCSPVDLAAGRRDYFLIPIKPIYALGLVDHDASADDLLGGKPSTLLGWNNVYYRRKSFHHLLRPHSRILWYVSGNRGRIVALSHLDGVEMRTPGELFKKYGKIGILEWRDLYELCGENTSQEIMALRFSHSFTLPNPIHLDVLKDIYKKERHGLPLRSPSRVPPRIFEQLYRAGFEKQGG